MTRPPRQQPMGAKAVRGSDAARRQAALLLEVWSGVRTAQAASEAMGVAVTRFYQLEARALQLIVSAMEPRPRGRQRTPESEITKLKAERQRLMRDVERFQSLYRVSQRAIGIAVAKTPSKKDASQPGGKRRRRPRKKARGQAVAAVLLRNVAPEAAREGDSGTTEQGPRSRARNAGVDREPAPRVRDSADDERRAIR